MQRRLLVDGSQDGRLGGLSGVEGGSKVKLQALGNLVLELELSSENVGGGPTLLHEKKKNKSARATFFLPSCKVGKTFHIPG